MHAAATASDRPTRRRRALLLIPAAAFLIGTIAAFAAARTRDKPYRGVYRQETVAVVAGRSGRLLTLDRRHGENVKPGDRLATLESTDAAERVVALRAECEGLRRRIDEASAKAASQVALRSDAIEKERLETRLRLADLLRTQFDVQLRQKALRELENGGDAIAGQAVELIRPVSTESQVVLRRLGLADAANHEEVLNTQVALCEDRLADLDQSQAELVARVERTFGLDRLRADLASAERTMSEVESADTTIAITSPSYGHVGISRREQGEFAAAGETLVEVFDTERPYILLAVPLSELSDLSPGRRVRVEFEGIETRKPLEGIVADVASEAERDADAATQPGAVVAQVRVKPTGRLWPTPHAGSTALVFAEN